MKKLILTVLIVCAASAVFAQLSFSGKAYVGVQLDVPEDDVSARSEDGVRAHEYSLNHRDKGVPRFDFAATALGGNYGIKLDTIFTASDDPFTLNGIYGWVNFLDNALKLSVGKISDGAWVINLDNEYMFDDVGGFRLEYGTPLDGLSVGVAFDVLGGEAGFINGDYDNNTERLFKQTIFGASYIHPLFNTVAAYDLGGNSRLLWGVNYTGIDKLTTAGVNLRAGNLALWSDRGTLDLTEKAVYQIIQRVSASLQLDQNFSGDKDAPYGLTFTPGCGYRATRDLTAFLEGSVKVIAGGKNSSDNPKPEFGLKPHLELALKGPAVFYAQYEVKFAETNDVYQDSHRFGFGIEIKAF